MWLQSFPIRTSYSVLVSLSLIIVSLCVCVQGKETTEEEDEVAVGMDKGFMEEFFEQVCFLIFPIVFPLSCFQNFPSWINDQIICNTTSARAPSLFWYRFHSFWSVIHVAQAVFFPAAEEWFMTTANVVGVARIIIYFSLLVFI